jgi:predicted short-subunit dehydrogenase-like oxidoreductase (DUF2520 family)
MQKQSEQFKPSIVIIGSGNLATHLGRVLIKRGYNLVQVFSKTMANAKALGTELNVPFSNSVAKLNKAADIYFLCVKDDVIHQFLNKIDLTNRLIVHTSGSTPLNILRPYSKNIGVFYPLQTFKKEHKAKFKKVPLLIEANTVSNKNKLLSIARDLSKNVYELNSNQRQLLHLAAVFACNFTNHLYSIAENICSQNQIDFNLLKPLIKLTAKRIESESPAVLQTGPAFRKDYKTIEFQELLLKDDPVLLEIYKSFTKDIIKGRDRIKAREVI